MEKTEYFSCSGGGTKGLMFSGFIDALEDHMIRLGCSYDEWRIKLKGLAGTSAGTICCLCIILGLNKKQRSLAISEVFNDVRNLIPCPDISLLVTSYGLENGNSFRNHIKNILCESGLNSDTTLGDIKRLFGKEFVCVASDLQAQRPVYFSSTLTPDVKIYDAIYMSCSIPFIFAPSKYNESYIVDGSLTEDVPYIFDTLNTLYLTIPKEMMNKKISSWTDYIQCLLGFPMVFQKNSEKLKKKMHIEMNGQKYTKEFPVFDLYLDEKVTEELISYGYMIVMDLIMDNNISKYMGTLVIIFIKIMEMDEIYDVLM